MKIAEVIAQINGNSGGKAPLSMFFEKEEMKMTSPRTFESHKALYTISESFLTEFAQKALDNSKGIRIEISNIAPLP